jgi:hypothetical protein
LPDVVGHPRSGRSRFIEYRFEPTPQGRLAEAERSVNQALVFLEYFQGSHAASLASMARELWLASQNRES